VGDVFYFVTLFHNAPGMIVRLLCCSEEGACIREFEEKGHARMKENETATLSEGRENRVSRQNQGVCYISLGMDAKLLGGLYFVESKMCAMCGTCERLIRRNNTRKINETKVAGVGVRAALVRMRSYARRLPSTGVLGGKDCHLKKKG
jgi:hypothetical protein